MVDGCALARAEHSVGVVVLIMPDEHQRFYDGQEIALMGGQCVQHIGTYKYATMMETEKTVPVIRIVNGVERAGSEEAATSEKTLFDEPGDCVSRKNFEVQKVLDSGDAIALEIRETISGHILTSDLEVLILAREGSNFYDKQVIKTPRGKCARQIGNYKYDDYGETKVIPIVAFK